MNAKIGRNLKEEGIDFGLNQELVTDPINGEPTDFTGT
jgi:hypothetical protein